MPKRPEQTVAYRVYHNGTDFIGIATLELPQIAYMTETLSGSGIAGEIENPTIGITQSISVKATFTSITPEVFETLDWTQNALYECWSALQVTDDATGQRSSVPYRVNFVGRLKGFPLGSMEQGKKHGNELELEVTRLEVMLDGQEKLLIDKLNFLHRVNGTDMLGTVRAQIGMNV
ncbi:phage major tail tube protein [uncultured Desulfovibrio sp.]|uniref:phage major tail tube protein n=1 Tax=uncultured Desulfovibrio sp. TaxID=167968 RepID=UPI00263776A6|nr:phage major tail tube protein [uncultured Desulfovibrio sp.]